MKVFENEAQHRHRVTEEAASQDRRAMEAEITLAQRGQWFAGGLSVAVLGVAVYFGSIGEAGAGAALVGANIVGLAVAFLGGKRRSSITDSQRRQESERDELEQ